MALYVLCDVLIQEVISKKIIRIVKVEINLCT